MAAKRQATKRLTAKNVIKSIEVLAGVNNENATNIFNFFANAWNKQGLSFLNVLDSGTVPVGGHKTARRRTSKETTRAASVTRRKTTKKTTKKAASKKSSPAGKVKSKSKKNKIKTKSKKKSKVTPKTETTSATTSSTTN